MQPDSAAELAGRLNAKTNNFQRLPTGIPQYTAQDIAQALGLIKLERYRLWIHVAYGHQIQFYPDLKREILIEIVNQFANEHWNNRPGMLGSLINTAVLEVLQAPVCLTCNGQKSVMIASKAVTCDSCKGSGIERFSDYWRAKHSDIHRQLWKRHWRDRYTKILEIVRAIDSGAKGALSNRLTCDGI